MWVGSHLVDSSFVSCDIIDADVESIFCEPNRDCLASVSSSAIFPNERGWEDLHSPRRSSDDHGSLAVVFRDSCARALPVAASVACHFHERLFEGLGTGRMVFVIEVN